MKFKLHATKTIATLFGEAITDELILTDLELRPEIGKTLCDLKLDESAYVNDIRCTRIE